ncbi:MULTISPECIES: aromatic acid/H+ symport family MFS transporter [unclassified Streptomyces]|uniref:MFS transporter n=1 Tax=unclassified Streptomyces TaxID=2593676 RepID=UPI000DB956E4|nr:MULTISPECIES: aromatic acid/H+ symport family MFS transporter [unclassified Streptomyces]MYT74851.1 MFS transporter [Streptomyces sp. SID8367]RAJ91838.1 AAHS family benzoate transporter-like MFS transporter [Streptomyces sp. PsTaAH-137]
MSSSATTSLAEASGTAAHRSRNAVIALCWALVLLDGIDTFIYGSVLPSMLGEKTLGLTAATAGSIGSWSNFGMLLGTILSGMASNWIGRRVVVLTSVCVFTVATLGTGWSQSAGMFGAFRFVCGFGLGALLPIAISYGMEFTSKGRRALATGVIMTAHQTGGAVAPLIALWLVDDFGWRSAFLASAVPALILLPVAYKLLPESPTNLLTRGRRTDAEQLAASFGTELPEPKTTRTGATDKLDALKNLFRGGQWSTTLCFWLTSFAGLLLVYGVGQWLPKIMVDLGYDTGDSLLFSTFLNVGGICGMLIAGRTADRIGPRKVVIAWFVLTAVFVYLMGVEMAVGVLYVVVFFAGLLLFSGQTMVYATVGTHHNDEDRPTALGWVSGMGRFGAIFGPWIGGALISAGNADLGFTMYACAALFGAVMMALAALTIKARAKA